MKKSIDNKHSKSAEYFKRSLKESGYTAETFMQTYNNVYPDAPISISAVQSWSTGRRSFAKTAALTVLRVAHIIEDPDSTGADFSRYANIAYQLVYGNEPV